MPIGQDEVALKSRIAVAATIFSFFFICVLRAFEEEKKLVLHFLCQWTRISSLFVIYIATPHGTTVSFFLFLF